MDKGIVTRYRIKKYLKILSLILFVFLVGLLMFSFVRILPSNIAFTNVSSSSVTVSWTTKSPSRGTAMVVKSNNNLPISILGLGQSLFHDTRDVRESELIASYETAERISNSSSLGVSIENFVTERKITNKGVYYTHHVEIKGLEPGQEYRVMVGDGLSFINTAIIGGAGTINTTEIPEEIRTPLPAYGQIKNANNENISFENLEVLSDGIVYLNYLDETTNKRSNVFSSTLNQEGSWYIDMSYATDENGEYFLDKYSNEITNILGELVIDAGPLGVWKKIINVNDSTPTEPIVLNMPGALNEQDAIGTLERIDSNLIPIVDQAIKGASAMEPHCAWIGWCACGYYDKNKVMQDCACDPTTLKNRGCKTQGSAAGAVSEIAAGTCGGNASPGQYTLYGGECKVCGGYAEKDRGLWVKVRSGEENKCQGQQNGVVFNYEKTEPETPITPSFSCKEGETTPISSLRFDTPCCLSGKVGAAKEVDMGYPGQLSCRVTTTTQTATEPAKTWDEWKREEYKTPAVESGTYTPPPSGPSKPLAGQPCRDNDKNLVVGVYNEKGECVSTTGALNDTLLNQACWSNITSLHIEKDGKTYVCSNNKWVLATYSIKCEPGASLGCSMFDSTRQCITDKGYVLDCNRSSLLNFEWSREEQGIQRAAINISPAKLNRPEKCDIDTSKYSGCYCNSSSTVINNGEYCYTITCRAKNSETTNGLPCAPDGRTCLNQKCEGPQVKGIQNSSSSILDIKTYINSAYSEDASETSDYIIDSSSGIIAGLSEGSYLLDVEEGLFYFVVKKDDVDTGVMLYADLNNNGVFDEDEDKKISEFGEKVKIQNIKQVYEYKLREGYNFVTFPFLVSNEDSRTAAGLITSLNEAYGDIIFSIAKFDGSWKIVGKNIKVYDNRDFQLIPGQGYVIKAKYSVDISIVGSPIEYEKSSDSAPITLYPGWNLIGTYGSGVKKYTAKSLIQSINRFEPVGFTADNVSRWESDVQRYDGYILTNENGVDIEYGFDYPINLQQSYFVRILNGRGNWQQDLQ
jgi:hypothetical protein